VAARASVEDGLIHHAVVLATDRHDEDIHAAEAGLLKCFEISLAPPPMVVTVSGIVFKTTA
jgi:hypothetical protein